MQEDKIRNFWYCQYTWLHRRALMYYIQDNRFLTEEERKELLDRAMIHDMDKMTLYLFWNKQDASDYHRSTAGHHLKGTWQTDTSKYDILESIFDMECAALTKSDKPLNAYDTVMHFYPELSDLFLPELKRLHMDSSYCAVTDDAVSYINRFTVTEKTILNEVAEYLAENPDNVYQKLKDRLCIEQEYEKLIQKYGEKVKAEGE